ncbi:MAG: Hsp20/alpha crystallin family protein [Candidatus Hydrothermarchaeales archaeon]
MLKIDEETLYKIADELDSGSRDILWYLWQKKHAKIDELAEVIAAPNHMDVLLRIRNIINPTAEKITGNSILAFEKSKVDYETGERILFSWWIIGERQLTRMQERETFIDIFDEDDHINVIMNLVDVQEKDVFLKVEGNKLTVSDNTIENPLYEEIHLPAEVDPREVNKTYKNGILVVRLEKISKECNHQEGPTALAGL